MHKGRSDKAQNGKAYYFFRCRGVHEEEKILSHGKTESGGYHIHHSVHRLVEVPAAAYEHKNDEEFNDFLNKGVDADRSDGIFRNSQNGRRNRKQLFQTGSRKS